MNRVILERPDHLEPGAIAHVREPRIPMPAKVALENATITRTIEYRAPRFELSHPIGGLARMELRHAPVVQVLPAAHRVGKMHAPVVAVIHVGHRRRDAALGHHGVRLAQQ